MDDGVRLTVPVKPFRFRTSQRDVERSDVT